MNIYKIKIVKDFLKKLAFKGTFLSVILRCISILFLFISVFEESPAQNTLAYILVFISLLYSWLLVNNVIEDEVKIGINFITICIATILLGAILDPDQIYQTFGNHTNASSSFKMILIIYLFITIFHFRDDRFYAEFLLNFYSDKKEENLRAAFLGALYALKYQNYYDIEKQYRYLAKLLSEDKKPDAFFSKLMSDFFEIFHRAETHLLRNGVQSIRSMRDKVESIRGFHFYPENLNKQWNNWENNEAFIEEYNELISKLKSL